MTLLKRSFLIMILTALAIVPIDAQTEKNYVIDARSYSSIEWNFGSTTRVSAKFRAQGGSGNDIEVYILDEDGFENWSNGHQTSTYYNSGKVTVGRFNINLAPGKYFLVMNNKFSMVSNKVVTFTFY
jgi:hypothetical protein